MINPENIFQFADQNTSPNEHGELQVSWQVPQNLPYFEGHFPGNPILPGVAILDLLQVLLKGKFQYLKSVKFAEVVKPSDTLTINAKHDGSTRQWSINISNQNGMIVCKTVLQMN